MTNSSKTPREDLPEGDRAAPSNAADALDNARQDDETSDSGTPGADTDVHGEPENPSG
ncbi:MAG: hypothetical protein ABWY36_02790 [Leifsonia sp.]